MAEENVIDIENITAILEAVKNIKVTEPQKCLFDSISDVYYRENYHSDILAYYLSYDLVKKKLIDWINRYFKENTPGKWIDFSLYKGGPDPKREEGRRDITIKSRDETHAIIIENKSNGADDMPYQIPRYYEDLKSKLIEVDAIIYLNKVNANSPKDKNAWNSREIQRIAKNYDNLISDKEAAIHLGDIEKKMIISTLNGHNAFTENVIDRVLQNSNDLRLSGMSLELRILFENVANGEYGMADKDFGTIMEKFNIEELVKCKIIFDIIPNKFSSYCLESLQSNEKHVAMYDNKIYFDFKNEDSPDYYYMEILFNDFLKKIIKFTFALRDPNNEYVNNRYKYESKLQDLNEKMQEFYPDIGFRTDGAFIVHEYKLEPDVSWDDIVEYISTMYDNIALKFQIGV